jgi:hypothetical protein
MNREFAFLFGVHNHQPVGNFGWVFENAVADCYLPFLKTMKVHPQVKFSAHYSGPLLEYFAEHCREAWDLLVELTSRGQMELLGGGFYEPILPIIPEADRRGQIEMMSAYLKEHFGRRPRGIWLTERVWEPNLTSTLASGGIEYTLLDENHFHSAGVTDLHDIYVTEDEGFPLRLLPIDQKLRYLIPFRDMEEIGRYFDEIRAKGGLAILGDDGEKFGLWPGTKSWVYGKGWLDRFLVFLEENEIGTMTYAEAVDARPPAARIYPPPASYAEMMEWVLEPGEARQYRHLKMTLPVADSRRFLRAGFFRDFFRKYPESRHLRDRMNGISRAVRAGGDAEATRELYRGQGNDPYWHGVFGGLYLPHLREAAYDHLLKAESRCPAAPGWRKVDYDFDGRAEFVRRDDRFGLLAKPGKSGGLDEIDYYPLSRNLSDVLSRRPETYHLPADAGTGFKPDGEKSIHEISKPLPPGIAHLIKPDRLPRRSAMDRFYDLEAKPVQIASGDETERGEFGEERSDARVEEDRLVFEQSGRVVLRSAASRVSVRKEIILLGPKVQVRTVIRNQGNRQLHFVQASEWNLYQIPEEIETHGNNIRLCHGRLVLAPLSAAELWIHPLQTLSQSEKDYDTIHQGYCLVWVRRVELPPGESDEFTIELSETP